MYKYIMNIIIIKPFVGRVNIINLWINNNKYDLSTFGASLIISIQTLCKSISKNKIYQTHASLSGTLHKKGGKIFVYQSGVFPILQFWLKKWLHQRELDIQTCPWCHWRQERTQLPYQLWRITCLEKITVSVSAHRLGDNSHIGDQWANVVDESTILNINTGRMYLQLIGRGVNSE